MVIVFDDNIERNAFTRSSVDVRGITVISNDNDIFDLDLDVNVNEEIAVKDLTDCINNIKNTTKYKIIIFILNS